jgi:RHS repeat-associated protein
LGRRRRPYLFEWPQPSLEESRTLETRPSDNGNVYGITNYKDTAHGRDQTFAYDNLGRITSVTQYIDQVPYLMRYTYNLLGQLATITYPSGHVITQSYDTIGRMASIADTSATYLSGLSYNAAGETLGMTMGNGVQGAFTYNDHLQLASLRYFKTGLTPDPLNLGYDYTSATQANNNGQIQAVHYYTQPGTEDQTKSESFIYDAWFRLKAAQTLTVNANTAGTWSLSWTYDRLGNRKQQTLTGGNLPGGIGQPNFTIDEATNRINGFSYDPAGNLTGDGVFTYAYDGANRLKQAQQVAFPNTVTSSVYLGPFRIKKIVGATTTRYIYSGNQPIAEYVNGSATPSKEYIYAGSTLLSTIAGTSTTYHHPDHLSNRAETDATGAVVRGFGNFPYGETWYESAVDSLKFTTYTRDSGTGETGSDYAMFRQYSSGQGRFMSADLRSGRLSAPQSLNRYLYAGSDPVNLMDPFGLEPLTCAPGYTRIYNGKGPGYCVLDPEPQTNPSGQGPQAKNGGGPKDDCHKFADMVEQIANSSSNLQQFMDTMASTFTGATDSSISAMRAGANKAPPAATRGFKDTGFQPQFRDGSNQVRHFTGGLVAGYDLGYAAALIFMNHREVEGKDDPDIALNGQSTYAGGMLANSGLPPQYQDKFSSFNMDFHDLANFIRDKICDH